MRWRVAILSVEECTVLQVGTMKRIDSLTYRFGLTLASSLSTVWASWFVIDYCLVVCLNFENFYSGIVSCKVVTGKIEPSWIEFHTELIRIVFFCGEAPITRDAFFVQNFQVCYLQICVNCAVSQTLNLFVKPFQRQHCLIQIRRLRQVIRHCKLLVSVTPAWRSLTMQPVHQPLLSRQWNLVTRL